MSLATIVTDERRLRNKCNDVDLKDGEGINYIISNLEYDLKNSKISGVGLSAIQIGYPVRLSIIRTKKVSLNLINAKIIEKEDPIVFKGEGCLSFPNIYFNTTRFNQITIENTTIEGNKEILVFEGFEAVAIQHEIDHQDGILFFDHKLKPIEVKKVPGRNELCPCGSTLKYKKCCGK